MIYFILSLIIGISAAVLVWVIFIVERDLSPNVLRRLDNIKRKTNYGDPEKEKTNLDISLKFSEYKFQAMENILNGSELSKKIKTMIYLSGINLHIDTFIFLSLLCAFAPAFLILLLMPQFKLMALFGIATFFIPTLYLNKAINQRFLDFSKQFPDALNLMASSMRAGHPLFSALDIVTGEMPKPISEVFETAKKDISLGIDTKEAFYSMTKIMPNSIDLRFFITAVLIQKEVGGNLAELLDKLSDTIRERFKLIGQLRVQTAQTRISGIVLGIVPVMVLLTVFFMNPEYIKPLFETPDGQLALAAAIVLIIAGFISIKKISTIEI